MLIIELLTDKNILIMVIILVLLGFILAMLLDEFFP